MSEEQRLEGFEVAPDAEDEKKKAEIMALWNDMQAKHGEKFPFIFAGILNNAVRDNWMLQHVENIVDHVSEKGGAMRALMEVRSLLKNRAKS